MHMPRVTFRATSLPFDNDPQEAEQYYAALGRAVVLWSRFESQFGTLLDCVCSLPEGQHLRPPRIPTGFTDQTKLLKSIINQVPALAALKAPIEEIVPLATDAAEDRHVIVHGHWNGFVKNNPRLGQFLMRRHTKGKQEIFGCNVSLSALKEMANVCDRLNLRLLPLTVTVVALYPPIDLRKPRGGG